MNPGEVKKLKIYLDTSVINFLFAVDSPEKKEITIEFFESRLDSFDVYISEIVLFEIQKTPDPEKREILREAILKYRLRPVMIPEEKIEEIEMIAQRYLDSGVIPQRKREDAMHIAICTAFEFDILLSWNFRHMANIHKHVQINSLNESMGYLKKLNLLTLLEVMYDDENQ
jgi:predicted nucleic acid-binding protein